MNGAVGVPAVFFTRFAHAFTLENIAQDGDNDGVVAGPMLTFRGRIDGPAGNPFQDTHGAITLDVLEDGVVIGSTSEFTPVPGELGNVTFRVDATLARLTPEPQQLTFRLSRTSDPTSPFPPIDPAIVLREGTSEPLTATLIVDVAGPTIAAEIDRFQLTFADFHPATVELRPRVRTRVADQPNGGPMTVRLAAIDGVPPRVPVEVPANTGDEVSLVVPFDLAPGLHTLTIAAVDPVGNAGLQELRVLVLDNPALKAPGTPVFTWAYDFRSVVDLWPDIDPTPADDERPWTTAFDRTTQTAWVLLRGEDVDPTKIAGNRLLHLDPATGEVRAYHLQDLDPNSGPHGVAFDFETHLGPRVWFTQRSSGRLSHLDLTRNELVTYDLKALLEANGLTGHVGDVHNIQVDRRGIVWVSDQASNLILELDFRSGEAGLASRNGTMVVHRLPPQDVKLDTFMGEDSAGVHGLEVVVDDRTNEAFVYATTIGDGRLNLLRTGGNNDQDVWISWDLDDLLEAEGMPGGAPLFPVIDNAETPTRPEDDLIYFGDPGFPRPGINRANNAIRQLRPGSVLTDPTAVASEVRTWHIPATPGPAPGGPSPGTPIAQPNQVYVDRQGTVYFIDRRSGVGRLDPQSTVPTAAFLAPVERMTLPRLGPIPLTPIRVVDATPLNLPEVVLPEVVTSDSPWIDPGDRSGIGGLDQYLVSGPQTGGANRGPGPFRGTLTAGGVVFGALTLNDMVSVSVFAELARREMSVVIGPGDARWAFQVLRDGSLIVTTRGPGSLVDRQIDLTRAPADVRFEGNSSAVIDGAGVVHAFGRDARGGLSEYRRDPATGAWTSRLVAASPAPLAADPTAFLDPARGAAALVTDSRGHLMLFYADSSEPIDLTARVGADPAGLVYSSVGVVGLNGAFFAYGTNQRGDLLEYAFLPGGGSAAVRRVPTPADTRDTMVFQDVHAVVSGGIRHVFAADGNSRLVHVEIQPDGSARAENVTELVKDTAIGYSPDQQPFAARVYGGAAAAVAPDGTLFVYGTNGRDLVEFERPSGGSWRARNLTNALIGPGPYPANRVFGNPAVAILSNGDRHILQINEANEVVEFYKLAGLDFATYNISLAQGNVPFAATPEYPNNLPGTTTPQNPSVVPPAPATPRPRDGAARPGPQAAREAMLARRARRLEMLAQAATRSRARLVPRPQGGMNGPIGVGSGPKAGHRTRIGPMFPSTEGGRRAATIPLPPSPWSATRMAWWARLRRGTPGRPT